MLHPRDERRFIGKVDGRKIGRLSACGGVVIRTRRCVQPPIPSSILSDNTPQKDAMIVVHTQEESRVAKRAMDARITLRMMSEQRDAIERIANHQNISINDVVLSMLDKALPALLVSLGLEGGESMAAAMEQVKQRQSLFDLLIDVHPAMVEELLKVPEEKRRYKDTTIGKGLQSLKDARS